MAKDYYSVLGLLPTAEFVVIKAAFKALAQRYHPDKFAGDPEVAKARMEQLNEAYRVLSDPERRQLHDQELMRDLDSLDQTFAKWMRAFVHARSHGD